MAILKYQKADGTIGFINQYNVIPTPVVQEKGQSTVDVMSQKAVTDELDFLKLYFDGNLSEIKEEVDKRAEKTELENLKSYFEGKFDDLVTCDCPELSVELLSYVKKSENTLARFNSADGEIVPTLIVDEDAEGADGIGIYTKEQIDSKLSDFDNIYAKQEWVTQQIENISEELDLTAYATKVWVGEQGYLTQHQDISGLASTEYVDNVKAELQEEINDAITGGEVDLSGYAKEQWVLDKKYLTEHQDISHLASKEELQQEIETVNNTIEQKVTEVTNSLDTKISEVKTEITNEIKGELPDMSQYATKTEVNAKPNVWIGSKDDYDGLGSYDNNTIYLIEIEQ